MEPTCSRDKSPSPPSLLQKHCAEGTGRHRRCCGSAQTGIERIADRIAEEVGRQESDEDADSGQKDQPDGVREVLLGTAQHDAPNLASADGCRSPGYGTLWRVTTVAWSGAEAPP